MPDEVRALKSAGELPDSVKLNETEEGGDDNFEFGSGGEEVCTCGVCVCVCVHACKYIVWNWMRLMKGCEEMCVCVCARACVCMCASI